MLFLLGHISYVFFMYIHVHRRFLSSGILCQQIVTSVDVSCMCGNYKGCPKHFATLSILQTKSTGNIWNFFFGHFWMSHLLLLCCRTVHFLAHVQEAVKVAWHGMWVLNRGLLWNFLWQGSKQCTWAVKMKSVLVKALLVTGLHEWQVLRKVKWRSSVTWVALVSQQQQLLRHCLNMLMNLFETTDGLQPGFLQLSSQYPVEVWTTLLMLSDIQKCVHSAFHEA